MAEKKSVEFRAKLIPGGERGDWPLIVVPLNAERKFGSKARISVKGTINGFPYRSSIFPQGNGAHVMMANRQMRDGSGAKVGDTVRVTMQLDTEPRTVEMPGDLAKAFVGNRKAREAFESLPPSHKHAYVEAILEAKSLETRRRRIDGAIDKLTRTGKR